ncbi:MAG: hypothetical protein V1781_05180 [Bacteroidota bacterium]
MIDGKGFSIDEVRIQILDAIKCEKKYIKSGKLMIDFRDFGDDMLRYRNVVHDYLTTDYKDNNWEVYMYSFDNSEWNKN